jgi:putative transcriptional regulator
MNGLNRSMSRSAFVDNVTAMLDDAGFVVSEQCAIRPKSFDVAARRGDDLILLKVLGNIDALDAPTGREMRRLGEYLDAMPLVVGLRSRDEELKPDVVYFRHGVPVLDPDTATALFVDGIPPMIYAAPGGLYVSIDGNLLADKREERDWSLGRLATELGVSRRTVSKYEDGMNASVEVAARIEGLFGESLTGPVDVLEGADEANAGDEDTPGDPAAEPEDQDLFATLGRAGFDVHPTVRAPFNAVGENSEETADRDLLTGRSELTKSAVKRARLMSSLGRVTRTRAVYFVESADRESIGGTAVVEEGEAESEDPETLRDLIEERAEG